MLLLLCLCQGKLEHIELWRGRGYVWHQERSRVTPREVTCDSKRGYVWRQERSRDLNNAFKERLHYNRELGRFYERLLIVWIIDLKEAGNACVCYAFGNVLSLASIYICCTFGFLILYLKCKSCEFTEASCMSHLNARLQTGGIWCKSESTPFRRYVMIVNIITNNKQNYAHYHDHLHEHCHDHHYEHHHEHQGLFKNDIINFWGFQTAPLHLVIF